MISTKKEYIRYLECDRVALGRVRKKPSALDYIWKYQRLMRKREYYENCKSRVYTIYIYYMKYKYIKLGRKLGFEIPINTFGPGLSIAHGGGIIINPAVKIGENCRIHSGTNIGTAAGYSDHAPQIGNNVYIGPGAKLFGKIVIGDNVAIGANSVVNKDVESNKTVGGIPAKIISDKGSNGLLIKATKIIND